MSNSNLVNPYQFIYNNLTDLEKSVIHAIKKLESFDPGIGIICLQVSEPIGIILPVINFLVSKQILAETILNNEPAYSISIDGFSDWLSYLGDK